MGFEQSDYVLGHSEHEQLRLIRQAKFLAPSTEHFLRDAGVAAGMRVLDIGCGMGDVTMLVGQLVGPAGKVVSIDLDQTSVEIAQKRASAVGLNNAKFLRADIADFRDEEPFDAIVGRLVLEFMPDPAAIIGRLCDMLRPGGILALQEPSWSIWLAHTSHLPLRSAVTRFIRDAFIAGGANTEMELPLYRGFIAAKLTPPQLRLDLPIGASPEFGDLLYDLLLTVCSRAGTNGLPLHALGDPTTLASRLSHELQVHHALASFVALVGAFARKRPD